MALGHVDAVHQLTVSGYIRSNYPGSNIIPDALPKLVAAFWKSWTVCRLNAGHIKNLQSLTHKQGREVDTMIIHLPPILVNKLTIQCRFVIKCHIDPFDDVGTSWVISLQLSLPREIMHVSGYFNLSYPWRKNKRKTLHDVSDDVRESTKYADRYFFRALRGDTKWKTVCRNIHRYVNDDIIGIYK